MEEAPPASTRGYNPIGEALRTENLQNLQAKNIQSLILILQYLIPTVTAPIKPAPQREQESITQDKEYFSTPPTPTDAAVYKWRRLEEGGELGPPPPLLLTATAPQQGPIAAPQQASQDPRQP